MGRGGMERPLAVARIVAIAAVSLCVVVAGALALEWPLTPRAVTGTFGEDGGDHFVNGIEIGATTQDVHPVLAGELVFRYDDASDYASFPRGLGSFVVLRHTQNVLSLYGHLQPGTLGAYRDIYDVHDRVGVLGESGKAAGPSLFLALYDEEAQSMVNPLALLPPFTDRQAPVIRRVVLAAGDDRQVLTGGITLKAGKVDVLASIADVREDVGFLWPLAPYGITVILDGNEVSRIVFDSLHVQEGAVVVGARGPRYEATYDAEGFLRCATLDLHAGTSLLRIVARDFAGNETARDFTLTIQE
jgi:hypothetical protein